jgi:hypothetical protein
MAWATQLARASLWSGGDDDLAPGGGVEEARRGRGGWRGGEAAVRQAGRQGSKWVSDCFELSALASTWHSAVHLQAPKCK